MLLRVFSAKVFLYCRCCFLFREYRITSSVKQTASFSVYLLDILVTFLFLTSHHPSSLDLHFFIDTIFAFCEPNFFLWSKISVRLIFPSVLFPQIDGYAQPPNNSAFLPFFLLWCCCESNLWNGNEDSLSLSASLSFQTSKRGYASNVFLRSWSAAKSYKWSREKEREEESEQNAEEGEGVQDKKMKGERM